MSIRPAVLALGLVTLSGAAVLFPACSKSMVSLDGSVGGVLRGRVTQRGGSPVSDVGLSVLIYDHPQCSGRLIPISQPLPITPPRDDGSYISRLSFFLLGPFRGCLTVIADPPDSLGLRPDTISGTLLNFHQALPYDTATVDFVLEPE